MAASLAALLFGAYRRDVLAALLLHPETSLHVREIARLLGKAPGTLLRELNQLAEAGLLVRRPIGNQVHFQADPRSPVFEDLRNVLKKTAGVADVLREALEPLAGRIAAAFVYGSVARGDERAGSDVDVMIVGKVSFSETVHALAPAQAFLRREISPNVYSPRELRAKLRAKDAFLTRVFGDSRIFLVGGDDDLGKPATHRQAQGGRRR